MKPEDFECYLHETNPDFSEWWVVRNLKNGSKVDCSSESAAHKIITLAVEYATCEKPSINHMVMRKKAARLIHWNRR